MSRNKGRCEVEAKEERDKERVEWSGKGTTACGLVVGEGVTWCALSSHRIIDA